MMKHPIHTGVGTLQRLDELCDLSQYSRAFVITDKHVATHWLWPLLRTIPIAHSNLVLPVGEQTKNADAVQHIWTAMRQAGCDRKSVVIALGGGVIGDMAGFAAATYMRGVACVQVPTTVLSQVDSSIGGKTGIDHDGVKNLVGTFTQPAAVILDISVLGTLPDREFVAGFAEIIKHGLIRDEAYLRLAISKRPREFAPEALANVVAGSCRIKSEVVERDEKEGGSRKLLNFGHTVGHAVEALSLTSESPLLHGEAVSIGMVIEADLAVQKHLLASADAQRVHELLQTAGLPVLCPRIDIDEALALMRSDKKNAFGRLQFTLLNGIGSAVWDQIIDEQIVRQTVARHMGLS